MTAEVGVVRRLCHSGVAVTVVVVWSLSGCRSSAVPAGPPSAPGTRDPSGLLLVAPMTAADMPAAIPAVLDPAFTVVSRLSWDNRADVGRPEVKGNEVVLTVTSPLSAPLAAAADPDTREAALLAYDAAVRADFPRHPNPPDLLKKRLTLTPERLQLLRAHLRVETETLSVAAIDTLTDETYDFASAPRFRAVAVSVEPNPHAEAGTG